MGSGGYEAGDSALGTAFLCGLFAALVTALVVTRLAKRRGRS
ncbi:hypothetical protein WEI85_13465 [Actinomycetes bacterium KLBMP 9797]